MDATYMGFSTSIPTTSSVRLYQASLATSEVDAAPEWFAEANIPFHATDLYLMASATWMQFIYLPDDVSFITLFKLRWCDSITADTFVEFSVVPHELHHLLPADVRRHVP